jgi:hypothetical protein
MPQSEFTAAKLSRRTLLKQTAAAIGLFTFVPKHVFGEPNQPSANDKLNIACVGVGGKGHSDAISFSSQNIVAR